MTVEQAQQWWQQNGHLTTHTGGGGLHPFRTGTLLTQPQDTDRGDPTNGGDFVHATTACNNTPYQYPLTAEEVVGILGDPPSLPGYAPCGCFIGAWGATIPPPRCAKHADPIAMPPTWPPTWPAAPASPAPALSDADVDRIARRVVELLREAKP